MDTTYAKTAEAYDRHASEIRAFLLRSVRDPEAAADLLADTFMRLVIEERADRWPQQTRAWLYRVASNLAASRGRHLTVAARADQVLRARYDEPTIASPESEVLGRERSNDLQRALARLDHDARKAVVLAVEGFDGATIAALIGRSPNATRTLLHRSRRRLRALLLEPVPERPPTVASAGP